MRTRPLLLLIAALGLAGCDRITGADQQKIFDAEAIGYACRVSLKTPEDCMKENDTMSPTSILAGWKAANKDVEGELIDPSMGKNPRVPPAPAPTATAPEAAPAAPGGSRPETGKPAEKTSAPAPKPEAAAH